MSILTHTIFTQHGNSFMAPLKFSLISVSLPTVQAFGQSQSLKCIWRICPALSTDHSVPPLTCCEIWIKTSKHANSANSRKVWLFPRILKTIGCVSGRKLKNSLNTGPINMFTSSRKAYEAPEWWNSLIALRSRNRHGYSHPWLSSLGGMNDVYQNDTTVASWPWKGAIMRWDVHCPVAVAWAAAWSTTVASQTSFLLSLVAVWIVEWVWLVGVT